LKGDTGTISVLARRLCEERVKIGFVPRPVSHTQQLKCLGTSHLRNCPWGSVALFCAISLFVTCDALRFGVNASRDDLDNRQDRFHREIPHA
jgi:hypothetical protein